jgi:hypothetical protein
MATYQDVGLVNSPNINNNNNNNLNTTTNLNRDSYDYSSNQHHHQPTNSKASTMPKYFYQHSTTSKPNKRDLVSPQNGSNYSTSTDNDASTNSNETSKRINNTNGKFSIQKMFRQGFSSWRTRRKLPPSLSTPPSSSLSTNISTPIPNSSSTTHRMTPDNDLSQAHPSTTIRSVSIDSMSPQRIIVTEQIAPTTPRSTSVDSVTVDFDRPPTNIRGYIQSPWDTPTETISQPTVPLPPTRTLPVQLPEPPPTTEPINPPKIPPPGIDHFRYTLI